MVMKAISNLSFLGKQKYLPVEETKNEIKTKHKIHKIPRMTSKPSSLDFLPSQSNDVT